MSDRLIVSLRHYVVMSLQNVILHSQFLWKQHAFIYPSFPILKKYGTFFSYAFFFSGNQLSLLVY